MTGATKCTTIDWPQNRRGQESVATNSLKYGILASALLITAGEGAEGPADWAALGTLP